MCMDIHAHLCTPLETELYKAGINIPSSAKVAQSSNSIQSSSNMHTKSQGLHPLHWRLHFSVQQDSFRVGIYTIVACLHY